MTIQERNEIFEKNMKLVYKFCSMNRKYIVFYGTQEDFEQSMFVKFLEIIPQYDESLGTLGNFVFLSLKRNVIRQIQMENYGTRVANYNAIHFEELEEQNITYEVGNILDTFLINNDLCEHAEDDITEKDKGEYINKFIDIYLTQDEKDILLQKRTVTAIAESTNATKQEVSRKYIKKMNQLKKLCNTIQKNNAPMIYYKKVPIKYITATHNVYVSKEYLQNYVPKDKLDKMFIHYINHGITSTVNEFKTKTNYFWSLMEFSSLYKILLDKYIHGVNILY